MKTIEQYEEEFEQLKYNDVILHNCLTLYRNGAITSYGQALKVTIVLLAESKNRYMEQLIKDSWLKPQKIYKETI